MNTQVISIPTTIARPTATPTRCPTPIKAIDKLAEMAEPPVPTLNTFPAVSVSSLVLAIMK